MRVWVIRFWLTEGIFEAVVDKPDKKGYVTINSMASGYKNQYLRLDVECFKNKDAALAAADRRREGRIAYFKRQIARLEKLTFDDQGNDGEEEACSGDGQTSKEQELLQECAEGTDG